MRHGAPRGSPLFPVSPCGTVPPAAGVAMRYYSLDSFPRGKGRGGQTDGVASDNLDGQSTRTAIPNCLTAAAGSQPPRPRHHRIAGPPAISITGNHSIGRHHRRRQATAGSGVHGGLLRQRSRHHPRGSRVSQEAPAPSRQHRAAYLASRPAESGVKASPSLDEARFSRTFCAVSAQVADLQERHQARRLKRQVAAALGVDQKTISNDLRKHSSKSEEKRIAAANSEQASHRVSPAKRPLGTWHSVVAHSLRAFVPRRD